MELFIPIGGLGTRLNAQDKTPKPLIKLKGKSLLSHAVRGFSSQKAITKVVVGLRRGVEIKAIERAIKTEIDSEIDFVIIEDSTSQVDTVFQMLRNRNDNFSVIIHNCDTFISFFEQIEFDCSDSIYFYFNSSCKDLSKIDLGHDRLISGVFERLSRHHNISSSGTYAFSDAQVLKKNIDLNWFEKTKSEFNFSKFWRERNKRLKFYGHELKECLPLGTPEQIERNVDSL